MKEELGTAIKRARFLSDRMWVEPSDLAKEVCFRVEGKTVGRKFFRGGGYGNKA